MATEEKRARRRVGKGVAAWLAGAWRQHPPPLSEAPADVARILASTGAGGLAWWRLQRVPGDEGAWTDLRRAYCFYAIEAVVRRRQIVEALGCLKGEGIEPILSKGWAIARLYPEPALRPYRDIDLYVRPAVYEQALATLGDTGLAHGPVELHRGVEDLSDRDFERLYERSRVASLDGVPVRLLAPEDELRHLCLHLLRHRISRPLWLCDVALTLETLPARFRWDWCLEGDARRADWVVCTLRLAHDLLGASLERADAAPVRVRRLPSWLVPAVLDQWGTPPQIIPPLMTATLAPAGLPGALRRRWPTPIAATIHRSAAFDEFPRLPIQLACVIARAGRWVRNRAAAGPGSRDEGGRE